ncbi:MULTISPECIES: peptide ABC transporter substrate-binding protein [Microbacterium]|uniref:ABC transporter substrate-binding protein n=1 Tax=Microbacterium aquilitoris TaxID=3067307 RepID=A0ABU3GJW9_9MICO|nr:MULTISPECIES: ABC transporter substrate-binding protein [unclassified Microbacterium]MDT3331000.1 ABC transporter substrate-binding protein [Microbacterium sp. KSW-18]MDT3344226.1 ABC transporter substrate-binding protein [Microbacterium sp. KSW2-22]SDG25631.1 oligopeptide transport system substrate-binding protein [Microbacterium sp. 77mftsu3.1]
MEDTLKRNKIGVAGLALLGATSLVLAGCASSGGDTNTDDNSSGGTTTEVITTNGSEPQNPLIPTNTNETGGGKVVDSIFAGLISYKADGSVENDAAESITTDSPTQLTVKIRDGLKFTNGEAVTADSFIKAWNYGALASNKQNSSYFFEDIEGFSYEKDSELTGLKKVDDLTFTITLNKPASDFAQRLGYSAYAPLPSVAFDDMKAFGENPIGNGPYKLAKDGAWQHNVRIDLVVNEDYDGPRKPKNGGLDIVFYANPDGAYTDLLGGNLDVLDSIPDSALENYKTDLDGRSVNQPAAIFQSLTIPEWLDGFQTDEEGKLRRAAISHSINRDQITDVIFKGTRTPAKDFTSPVIDGWSDSVPGNDVLDYDPELAKELWDQANAIKPYSGKEFTISYNADGPHQAWVDAVSNSVSKVLGIKAVGKPFPDFATYLDARDNEKVDAFRSGWQADYPGLYNFLGPLYATGAGSNDGKYSDKKFDDLLAKGISETDEAARNSTLLEAQSVLFEDLPAIPLWYSNVNGGWADGVKNVEFGWNSVPLYYEITK